MTTFQEAKKSLFEELERMDVQLGQEDVPLEEAHGRILASPVLAPTSLPLFDNSAMDGFAIRAENTVKASRDTPTSLRVMGITQAGDPPANLDEDHSAQKIMTGAPIPSGCDAIIPKEDVEESADEIRVFSPVKPGRHIRRRGEDIAEGEEAIGSGVRITVSISTFLASLGIQTVTVCEKPRVSVIVTGSELVAESKNLSSGKIIESNSFFLRSALEEMGIQPRRVSVLRDDESLIQEEIKKALSDSHLVLITGGVSVGDYDYTREILQKLDVKELFWRVAQKPGKPLYAGSRGKTLVLGLPGNPYAVFTCFYLYARPALFTFMGASNTELRQGSLRIAKDVERGKRGQFLKGQILETEDGSMVIPLRGQGSHRLRSLVEADCLIHIPIGTEIVSKGTLMSVYFLPT